MLDFRTRAVLCTPADSGIRKMKLCILNPLAFFMWLGVTLSEVTGFGFIDDFYKFSVTDVNGNPLSLWKYRHRPSLVVNVASQCGFTDCHYTSLMKLSQSNLGEKLNIILFPCNQFGNQEPGSMEEIQAFIRNNYPGNYILLNKVDVIGENADPVFDFLSDSADKEPTWNFWKYLVASDGTVIDGWGPWVSVDELEEYLVAATQMASHEEL